MMMTDNELREAKISLRKAQIEKLEADLRTEVKLGDSLNGGITILCLEHAKQQLAALSAAPDAEPTVPLRVVEEAVTQVLTEEPLPMTRFKEIFADALRPYRKPAPPEPMDKRIRDVLDKTLDSPLDYAVAVAEAMESDPAPVGPDCDTCGGCDGPDALCEPEPDAPVTMTDRLRWFNESGCGSQNAKMLTRCLLGLYDDAEDNGVRAWLQAKEAADANNG